jgi:antitoxin HicB
MTLYIGLIHKEPDSSYGVQFPDLPGHVTAGDTLDEAFLRAHELISLLARHWREDAGEDMPKPRRLQDIKAALAGDDILDDAIMIAVSTDNRVFRQAAE